MSKKRKQPMTKEQIYDEQVSPLMAQIIAICKEHKIANVCSFSLDDDLLCTTCMTEEAFDPPDKFKEIVRILCPPTAPVLMVTTRDGNGNITRMDAILP